MDDLHYLILKYKGCKNKSYAVAGLVSETHITDDFGDKLIIERAGNLVGVSENDVSVTTYVDFSVLEK